MSSIPPNGTYKISNVGSYRKYLAVDQTNNKIVLKADSTTDLSIRWILNATCHGQAIMQSAITGQGGCGFFYPEKDDRGEPILYTPYAEIITITHVNSDVYNLRFTKRKRALVLDVIGDIVQLDNYNHGTATQQWRFVDV